MSNRLSATARRSRTSPIEIELSSDEEETNSRPPLLSRSATPPPAYEQLVDLVPVHPNDDDNDLAAALANMRLAAPQSPVYAIHSGPTTRVTTQWLVNRSWIGNGMF